jgi:anti-anti-sigma factor
VSTSPDGITSVLINGHLDSVTSTALEQRLKQLVSDGNHKFVIDLSDVTYISSGGWGIFTGEVRGLREHGGDIVLVGMSPEVYDVYELLGFDDVLKAFTNPQEASEYFDLPPEERLAVVSRPAVVDTPVRAESEDEDVEAVPGESYVPEWESLKIEATTVGPSGEMVVLSLRGIIDTVSAESLRAALAKIIQKDIFKIVVDMSLVEYVSSGGWGTFTERLREVRRNSGDIKLFGMDPDVYYVFTMLGFNIVLSSFDILTEAIEDFGRETHTAGRPTSPLDTDNAEPDAVAPGNRAVQPVDLEPDPGEAPEIDLSQRDVRDVAVWEDAGNGVKIAHLSGFIEASAVDELATRMMQELTDEPVVVLFDLERVEYISSTGWGQFADCAETIQTWGGVVALYGLGPDLHDIYSCLEFQSFIKEYPDRLRAIEGAMTGTGSTAPANEPTPPVAPADPAVETHTVEEFEDPGVESVDDILGDDGGVSTGGTDERSAAEPVDDQTHRWPGETPAEAPDSAVKKDFVDEPVEDVHEHPPAETGEPVRSQAPLDETPDRVPEATDPQFVDMSDHTDVVDVGSAVSDKNIEKDERLREIGWGKYGEKLKKKNQSTKKKREEDK